MLSTDIVILGCGFTGRRVAEILLAQGRRVSGTSRHADSLADLAAKGLEAVSFDAANASPEELARLVPTGPTVLYSIPTLRTDDGLWEPAPEIFRALGDRPRRLVYLSTTGVYGSAREVDELTPAAPESERQRLRVQAEQAAQVGPWESLILRPAAIYGPGRGVQVALPRGDYKLVGDGSNFVSRIHVDDLAAITAAALLSDVTGGFPVADEQPSSSREIAEFCAELLGVPLSESVERTDVSETRRSDRRVDGAGDPAATGGRATISVVPRRNSGVAARRQPLITPIGRSRATFAASPALWTTSIT